MAVTVKLDGSHVNGANGRRQDFSAPLGTEIRIQQTEGNYVVNYDFVGLESTTRIYRAMDKSPVLGAKLS